MYILEVTDTKNYFKSLMPKKHDARDKSIEQNKGTPYYNVSLTALKPIYTNTFE